MFISPVKQFSALKYRLLRLLNLRLIIILLTVMLAVDGLEPSPVKFLIDKLDSAILRAASKFSELPSADSRVTVVHIPDVELDAWGGDILAAQDLLALLRRIQSNNTGDVRPVIGVLLDRPLTLFPSRAELLLRELDENKTVSGNSQEKSAQEKIVELKKLRDDLVFALQDQSVILGVFNGLPMETPPIKFSSWQPNSWLKMFHWWDLASVDRAATYEGGTLLGHYPVLSSLSDKYLVMAETEKVTIGGFLQQFLSVDQVQNHGTDTGQHSVFWHQKKGLMIGAKRYPLSFDGSFVPLYSEHTRLRTVLKQMTLAAALRSEPLDDWILIGRDNSPQLDRLAQSLASMGDSAYLYTPPIYPLVRVSFIAIFLIISLIIFSRFSVSHPFLLMALLISSLVGAQVFAQVQYRYWAPVGDLLLFMPLCWFLLSLAQYKSLYRQAIAKRADEASRTCAEFFIEKGDLEKASYWADLCTTSELLLSTLYKIAFCYQQRNDSDMALKRFKAVKRRKSHYRDTEARIKTLAKPLAAQQKSSKGTGPLDKTVALGQAQNSLLASNMDVTVLGGHLTEHKTFLGRYEVQKELGRGAMGTVFLGFDPKISRPVAIKTLNYKQFTANSLPEIKARFFKEAKTAGGLNHPNIVQVYDVGEQGDQAFIAMDYAEGSPLSEFTHESALLGIKDIYELIARVADALQYAHRHQIIHRDIKPGNIIYNPETRDVKVTDFGIARVIDSSQTRTGEIVGSPLYMAPEQIKGQKVSPEADIFSLGVTFYELLTGELPFRGDNLASLSYEIVNAKHQSIRSIRDELPQSAVRITNKALQKQPGNRFPSAGEMAVAIHKALRRDFS